MRHRRQRALFLGMAGFLLLGAAILIFSALKESLVFFVTPTEAQEHPRPSGNRFRLGGMVEVGSVIRQGKTVSFTITDGNTRVSVVFTGLLPDLFREGQGIVAEGTFDGDGIFTASSVLAKHDETYMPPEAAKALRKSEPEMEERTGVVHGEEK